MIGGLISDVTISPGLCAGVLLNAISNKSLIFLYPMMCDHANHMTTSYQEKSLFPTSPVCKIKLLFCALTEFTFP